MDPPNSEEGAVFCTLADLYRLARTRRLAIRLLGVQLSNLVAAGEPEQLTLPFTRPRSVGQALAQVRQKYSYDSVHFAGSVAKGK